MPSKRVESALALFEEGFNCAQAVCAAFGPALGLHGPLALKAAQAFGGGLAHRGETCGALAGACIVLGLRYGKTDAADDDARDRIYRKVHQLLEAFAARNGACRCRELIGYNLSDPDQYRAAKEAAVFRTLCPRLVRDAAEILEGLL